MLTRRSSVFQIIPEIRNTWSIGNSFDTWHYAVIWAPLCVSFWSKSKETNVFPKHILKSKAHDQSTQAWNYMIQASKKLFCHVIGNNYLRKVLRKFLINIESTWRREIKEQTPELTLLHFGRTVRSSHRRCFREKSALKNFTMSSGNTFVGVSFYKSCRPATLLERDPKTGVFLWILRNF